MSDAGFTSFEDEDEIASKIIEMADRVKAMHAIMPGAQATWCFELDDVEFRVVVSVNTPANKPTGTAPSSRNALDKERGE